MKKKLGEGLFSFAKSSLGGLVAGLAFGKFSKFLPVKKLKETKKVIAFWHPKPFWEKHILIVPKKPIKKLTALNKSDFPYISEVFLVTKELVKDLGWEKKGYALQVNGGSRQKVAQLHFHLHCGKKLNGLQRGNN